MLKPLAFITKYKYVNSTVFFLIWMVFFDGNSFLFMNHQYNELQDLKAQERFLTEEIEEMTKLKNDLFSDDDKLERYARENFFFKKDEEDVYVIELVQD